MYFIRKCLSFDTYQAPFLLPLSKSSFTLNTVQVRYKPLGYLQPPLEGAQELTAYCSMMFNVKQYLVSS